MTDHQHRHERMAAVTRTSVVSAVVNLVLTMIKVLVGFIANSQALIADGIHSLSDLLSDLLVWIAGRHATQAPDEDHPYGHGRLETLATLVLGALLIMVGVGIGWDATGRLFNPAELPQPGMLALWVAGASVLVKEWLFWYTLHYAKRVRSDMLRANAWHHRTDAFSSVVVFVGVGGTMAGLTYLDAIAAALVAVMIAKVGWDLGFEAVKELIDTGLEEERVAAIRATIATVGGVRDLHMLRTRKHGGQASADVHLLVDPRISVSEGHAIAVMVEQRLKQEIDEITDVTVHIDPEDDDAAPPTMGLPLRAEALGRLERHWAGIAAANHRTGITLHYLGGRIEAEVMLPLAICEGDPAQARILGERLQAAVCDDADFGRVTACFR
jgi:cation diffusion facilitator family transporter